VPDRTREGQPGTGGPDGGPPDFLVPIRGRSRILGNLRRREGATGVAVALLSTAVFVTVIVLFVTTSPSWPAVKQAFFNPAVFRASFPSIAHAFLHNILYFTTAEVCILPLALLIAVLRSLPGPVFFPLRAMAIVYVDLFRGIPTILVVFLLGLGVPSLGLSGTPNSAAFWAVVGLVLSYSAYVAEVYRSGIESVHPSQTAAARSLGLSRSRTLRYVVIPQAVRRVLYPLLNDFIGLQKDTALVAFVGLVPEALQEATIIQNATFNFTPLIGAALMFLIVTVPMTRFADFYVGRRRARQQGGVLL